MMTTYPRGSFEPNGSVKNSPKYGHRLAIDVLEELAASEPNHIVGKMVKTSSRTAPLDFLDLNAAELCSAVNFMSHEIDLFAGADNGSNIAFIGLQDFRYWVMELAAMKTSHPIVLASPRNALPNSIALLQATGCNVLFYSGAGTPLEAIAKALQQQMPSLTIVPVPTLEEMLIQPSKHYPYTKIYEETKDDVILIPHTSGSTACPKPIYYTNSFFNRLDADRLIPQVPGRTLANLANLALGEPGDLTFAAFPFFHISGIGCLGLMLFYRLTIVIGPNYEPPSGKMACEIVKSLEIKVMLMLPFMCDTLIEFENEMKTNLRELRFMVWLGGPLARKTGTWIIENLPHVNLWQFYGSTEAFMFPMLVPPKSHWYCFEFHPQFLPSFEPVSEDSDLLELVVRRTACQAHELVPAVFIIFPDHQEWRTRDLFRRCTDVGSEHLLTYEGRVDDILVLNTALKVNPVHVEMSVSTHPALSGCLVFGERHNTIGMLLEPRSHSIRTEDLISEVWPTIETLNAGLPEHARVLREMILVSSPEKPFARAAKGTVVRKITIESYKKEIEALYAGNE